LFKEQTYDLYEAVPGFIVGMVLTYGVSAMTFKPAAREIGG
jgi:Na+/proline symporter